MSAVDELERMADKFDVWAKEADADATSEVGRAREYRTAADVLRTRAVELRARHAGPARRPRPMAADVRAETIGNAVGYEARVEPVGRPVVNLPAPHAWPAGVAIRISAGPEAALVDVRAGETIEIVQPTKESGERPDLEDSEVAGEEE